METKQLCDEMQPAPDRLPAAPSANPGDLQAVAPPNPGELPAAPALHDCIYLSTDEFMVLAAGGGLTRIRAIFRGEASVPDGNETYRALFSLCGRGLMTVEEEQGERFFRPTEQVRQIFTAVRAATRSVMYTRTLRVEEGQREQRMMAYEGGTTAVVQFSDHDENALRLFALPGTEFRKWVQEEGYIREMPGQPVHVPDSSGEINLERGFHLE